MVGRLIGAGLALALVSALALAGCGDDGEGAADAGASPVTEFRLADALLPPADLPSGFFEIESEREIALCGVRISDIADATARRTFQNTGAKVVVEQVLLRFSGAAAEGFRAFEETVDDCAVTSTGSHRLTVSKVPVPELDADEVFGVRLSSISGRPPIRALTVVVRDGREIVLLTTRRADKLPGAGTVGIAAAALARLRGASELGMPDS